MPGKARDLIPYVGEKKARERLEELFDRKSTTGFLLGATIGGLLTTIVSGVAPGGLVIDGRVMLARTALWIGFIALTVLVAIHWERLSEATETIEETAEEIIEE